jgi:GT2 family glycosyltransferase
MRVSVITPYYKESLDVLLRCRSSVFAQSYKDVRHYMLADGHPCDELRDLMFHVELPRCDDYGDTPRLIGCAIADAQGADAILLLDADCWLEKGHIQHMVEVMQGQDAPIVTCPRNLYRLDGSFMAVDTESNGIHFNDTNCYLIRRDAFHLLKAWGLKDKRLCIIDDRVFWDAVKGSGLKIVRSALATVNYPTSFAFHYSQNKETIPDNTKVIMQIDGELRMVTYPQYKKLTGKTEL